MALSDTRPIFQPYRDPKPPYSIKVKDATPKAGEGIPRRNPECVDGVRIQPAADIFNTYDIVVRGAKLFGDAPVSGTRKIIKVHNEETKIKKIVDGKEVEVPKQWTYYESEPYKFISYKEYKVNVDNIGSGLRALGLQKADLVQIYAATSAKWLTMAHACASQSILIATAYDTLGQVGLTHSLKQTDAKATFCDAHLLPTLIEPLKTATEVTFVIYSTDAPVKQDHIDKLKAAHDRLRILSYDELYELGKQNPVAPNPPDIDDLCCVMYTSGSTGTPKGVPLTHKNIISAVSGASSIAGVHLGKGDRVLACLPLAHVLEIVLENSVLFWGAVLGYSSPRTLADRAMKNCRGDLAEFKPNLIPAVPALYETIAKGVKDKIASSPWLTQKLFWGAYTAKSFLVKNGLPGSGILDAVVFSKVKDATGGQLRLNFSGGGAMSLDTQHFVSHVIAPLVVGYGLTETSAMGFITDPCDNCMGSRGKLTAAVEVKLVDFPDAGYFTANKPEQGEIWIRGGCVVKEYFKNPEETAAAFEDGWFKTGDIGEWDEQGRLKIIDRKKNLVKTLNGEYIALEKLEAIYRSAQVVANLCVYADQSKVKPIAIVVPVEANLKKLAKENGIDADFHHLVTNEKVLGLVHKQLLAVGKAGGLAGIELIQGVALTDDEWTPQNGLITSAQKLNRRDILKKYQKEVDHAYTMSS